MSVPIYNFPGSDQPIDLQTLVETHDKPFVIIDRDYRILAANSAYRQTFGQPGEDVVGKACYKVSHGRSRPCHEEGEDCPYIELFENNRQLSTMHIHVDPENPRCQVRVSSYPLQTSGGELLMGELIEDLTETDATPAGQGRMIGRSRAFMQCINHLNQIAGATATVLLTGETGTGKELAAHYIHERSGRADRPFVVMDCTVLPETLFEAEVFGHERGAFTGSVGERIGLFEQANGGTLFMDEIGELPLAMQSKLLRALESGSFRRVGSNQTRSSEVRVVCATNRDLSQMVAQGDFREDLYYRIACLSVHMPALRERISDIDLLAPSLLQQISKSLGRPFRITRGALDWLKQHDYPGNIRELRNLLLIIASRSHRLVIYADDIGAALDQPTKQRPASTRFSGGKPAAPGPMPIEHQQIQSLTDLEAQYIAGLLKKYANNRKRVASVMGISERTLYRKIKRYELA